jgi:hypothetical protein
VTECEAEGEHLSLLDNPLFIFRIKVLQGSTLGELLLGQKNLIIGSGFLISGRKLTETNIVREKIS